ncbi:MAG: single-stranded-DNA-specific exonuclease RecJ [Pseudomonadota bacterium]|nr:single-stranded-DNA-specific exonuclease RecJ [Pseudomonadota bacterium]
MAVAPAEPVFGVLQSVSGLLWKTRNSDYRKALAFSQRLNIPSIVGQVLAARSVDLQDAESFMDPKLRDVLPDPSILRDMDKAVDRVAEAIFSGQRMAVFGDYDVDGATCSALLKRYFGALGMDVDIYIPDRVKEGYGPTKGGFEALIKRNAELVLTVDCGTTADGALEFAGRVGLDVIVLDHHSSGPSRPKCVALVNPNRLDDRSGQGALAAVGVVFLFLVGLNRSLRLRGFFEGISEPNLLSWLDLVALGTVCDVVPLHGLNRALVRQGIRVLATRSNLGLAVLGDLVGLEGYPDSYHLGFVLGPRINAGGRVGDPALGHRLLTTEDPDIACELANQLDSLNKERQTIETIHLEEAFEQVKGGADSGAAIVVQGANWHPGVIGLVASRLAEQFRRPSLAIAVHQGLGKGSGRSVRGIDIGDLITGARQAGILESGGGHPMAAGFTVREDKLPELRSFIDHRISPDASRLEPVFLELDAILDLSGVSSDLVESFDKVGPFGSGNPRPRVAFQNLRVLRADTVGDGSHVRCVFGSRGGDKLLGIAFRASDRPMGQALLTAKFLHVAGSLRINTWGGKQEAQLFVEDVAYPGHA